MPPARLNAKSSVPETARLTGGAQPRETSPEAYRGGVTAVAAKDLKQMTLTTWGLALGAFMLLCTAVAGLASHFVYQDEA